MLQKFCGVASFPDASYRVMSDNDLPGSFGRFQGSFKILYNVMQNANICSLMSGNHIFLLSV